MSEGQAGTETRRRTIYVCRAEGCDLAEPDQYTCPRNGCPRVRKPGSFSVPVEVVEASDPEGTAREALTRPGDQLQSAAARMAEWILNGPPGFVPYEVGMAAREARSAVDEWTEARAASGGTRPAFTERCATPGAVYSISISSRVVECSVALPAALCLSDRAAQGLEDDIHDALEAVLSAVAGKGTQ